MAEVANAPLAAAHGVGRLRLTGSPEHERPQIFVAPNADGTYTLTFSPKGDGRNGIPTGKDFYGVLRAYVPSPNVVMKVSVKKQ